MGKPALAQSDSTTPHPATEDVSGARSRAIEAFKLGMAMYRAGNLERAAELLLESHREFPSKGNTLNAAICLERLGRIDEALDLYEEAIGRFAQALDAEDRAAVPVVITTLRAKVGSLELAVNAVGAVVLIDGRERGRSPLGSAIRVTPGRHLVRVVKDGYRSFEQTIEPTIGSVTKLDVVLPLLETSGSLRVEDPALIGAAVVIDGVEVGRAPWEGTLAPGAHVVSSRTADRGSAPTRVTVLAGQTTLLRLRSGALGARLTLRVRPATALIRLGDAELGTGTWSGALPVGDYQVELSEPGYVTRVVALEVTAKSAERTFETALEVDPSHPRWPQPTSGWIVPSLHAGFALGRSMRSDAEAACPTHCNDESLVLGALLTVRGAYEFRVGLAIEAAVGYLTLSRTFQRELTDPSMAGATYTFDDVLRLRGFWLGAGASYEAPIGKVLGFFSRATVGVAFAQSSDAITGSVATELDSAPVAIERVNSQPSSALLLLMPELGLFARFREWRIGASLGLLGVVSEGPAFDRGVVTPDADCETPGSAACLADSHVLENEVAYDSFLLVVPQIFIAYAF